MAKIFETSFKNGSLLERYSGNAFTLGAEGSFIKAEKGLGLDLPQVNGYAYTTLPTIFTNIGTTNFSISLYCKINTTDPDWSAALFNAGSGALNEVMLWCKDNKIELTVCDAAASYYSKKATDVYEHGRWYHIVFTWIASTNTVALYIDGVLNDTAGTGTNGAATSNLTLGSQTTYAWQVSMDCTFGDVTIYDHILTPSERTQLYSEFLNSYPITKSIDVPLLYPRSVDLSGEVGIAAAYNMIASPGQILTDISGNGNNGTIVGAVQSKDGLVFNGSNDYIDLGSTQELDEGTILYRFNQKGFSANESHIG